jgi:hypothetical protein
MIARETLATEVVLQAAGDADLAGQDGTEKATVGSGHDVVVAVRKRA